MDIKVFGERNTGTNALIAVIRKNSKSRLHPGTMVENAPRAFKHVRKLKKSGFQGRLREALVDRSFRGRNCLQQWKHAAPSLYQAADLENTHFVFAVRHPLSWLRSLYKNPYHTLGPRPANFSDFLSHTWTTVGRDNLPEKTYEPAALYAAKLTSYLRFMKGLDEAGIGYSVVKFEDFVVDQVAVLEILRPHLTNPSAVFVPLERSTKDKTKNATYYREYYGQERWRDEIDLDIRQNFTFDPQLLERFGYQL